METFGGLLQTGQPFDLGSASRNASFAGITRAAQGRLGLAGLLPPELTQAGGDAVTAHPHVCAATGRLVTFSYRVSPALPAAPGAAPITTQLTFYELGPDLRPAATQNFKLTGFAFLHDFALTASYYVVFQNPVTVDNAPYLLGAAPAASCVRWVPGTPTLVHLIPRPGAAPGTVGRTFAAPPFFVFHHANAYEEETAGGGRKVVVDSIHYVSLPAVGREALASQRVDPDAAFTSRLRRVEIDLETNVMVRASLVWRLLP